MIMEFIDILAAISIGIPVTIIAGLGIYFWNDEKHKWNEGKCPDCGENWHLLKIAHNGDRVYACKHDHMCVISFHNIDKL
jgi:hypothetical protein